jgi:hypothetical protein
MTLDLATLALTSVGSALGIPKGAWLRAALDIAGIQHFVDLVAVRADRYAIQRAASRELDAMLRFHHLACGADGPFATLPYRGHPRVLFVTPSAR